MLFYNKTVHFSVDLLDVRLVLDSSATIFWRKKVLWEQISQAGVWSGKSRNFLPCNNFMLYNMKCNDLTVTFSVWPGLCCPPPPQYWGGRQHPQDSPPHLPRSVPLTAHLEAGVKRQHRSVTGQDYICTETGLLKVICLTIHIEYLQYKVTYTNFNYLNLHYPNPQINDIL